MYNPCIQFPRPLYPDLKTRKHCAQVKQVYGNLLESREECWEQSRCGVSDGLRQLAEHHREVLGQAGGTRRAADANLSAWFEQLAGQVDELACGDSSSGRSIRQVGGIWIQLSCDFTG